MGVTLQQRIQRDAIIHRGNATARARQVGLTELLIKGKNKRTLLRSKSEIFGWMEYRKNKYRLDQGNRNIGFLKEADLHSKLPFGFTVLCGQRFQDAHSYL